MGDIEAGEAPLPRPLLHPAIRPLWRDNGGLQLGMEPARSFVLSGIDPPMAKFIASLDGTRTEDELHRQASACGIDIRALESLLGALRRNGLVIDDPGEDRTILGSPRVSDRLAPDHAALSILTTPAEATEILLHRRERRVLIYDATRVGTPLASLLAASGVGHVTFVDNSRVRLADTAPAGVLVSDEHRRRELAALEAVRRAAPEVEIGPLSPNQPPDLVILTAYSTADMALRDTLHRARTPHLAVGFRGITAVVGPFVRPGETSCLRCGDLSRTDRDPSWPVLAAQLATPRRGEREPCDVVLAALAASLGALQALAHLDGKQPATLNGTLEITLPDWRVRRRSWFPHSRCGCGAALPRAG